MQNSRLHVRVSSFRHEQGDLSHFISSHPFNSGLEVILPFLRPPCPEYDAKDILGGHPPVFHVARTSLTNFLSEAFLQKRVKDKSVQFRALAVGRSLHFGEQGACIAPSGLLRLIVNEDSYQRLGLTGTRCSQQKDEFIVDVHLGAKQFGPDRRYYHRVAECLGKTNDDLLMWCLESVNGIPVDIDGEEFGFSFHKSVLCKHTSRAQKVDIPRLKPRATPMTVFQASASSVWDDAAELQTLYNWLGGIFCDCEGFSFASLSSSADHARIVREKWEGMIASEQILEAVNWAREFAKLDKVPWVALQVWGFPDSPVSWGEVEHSRVDELSGGNDYTLIVLPEEEYCLFVAAGKGDLFKKI